MVALWKAKWLVLGLAVLLAAGRAAGVEWNVDADGPWSTGTNWTGGIAPNGVGAAALFGTRITVPHTVTVSTATKVGSITFNNSNKYTIAGTSALTFEAAAGSSAQLIVSNGSHAINPPMTLSSNLAVDVSGALNTLSLNGIITAGTMGLTKSGAGVLAFGPGTNTGKVAVLTVVGGGVTGYKGVGNSATTGSVLTVSGADANVAFDPNLNWAKVETADFSAGTGTVSTGSGALRIYGATAGTLKLPDQIVATFVTGTSSNYLSASSANLVNNAVARTLSYYGGTLKIAAPYTAVSLPQTALAITSAGASALDLGAATSDDVFGKLTLTAQTAGTNLTLQNGNSVTFNTGITVSGSGAASISPGATAPPMILLPSGQNIDFGTSTATLTIGSMIGGASPVTKIGTGTLALSGSNTYTGLTTISGGALKLFADANLGGAASPGVVINAATLEAGASFAITRPITVANANSRIQVDSGFALSLAGVVSSSGGGLVNVPGPGVLLVNGTCSAPVVVQGTGILGGIGNISGGVTVQSGAHLAPAGVGSPGTLSASSLTFLGNENVDFEIGPAGGSDRITVTGTLTPSAGQTTKLNFTRTPGFVPGTYTLISFGTGPANTTAFQTGTVTGNLVINSISRSGSSIVADIGLSNPLKTWTGNGDGTTWDAPAANWSGSSTTFADNDQVAFNDTTHTAVTVTGTRKVAAIVMNNSVAYSFSGPGRLIDADGGYGAALAKNGAGTLTIGDMANTFSGGVAVNSGTVSVSTFGDAGAASALGSGPLFLGGLATPGTLLYTGATASGTRPLTVYPSGGVVNVQNGTAALTASGAVTLNGPLSKTGPGSLIFSGQVKVLGSATHVISDGMLTMANVATGTAANSLTGQTFRVNNPGTPARLSVSVTKDGSNPLAGATVALSGGGLVIDGNIGGLGAPTDGLIRYYSFNDSAAPTRDYQSGQDGTFQGAAAYAGAQPGHELYGGVMSLPSNGSGMAIPSTGYNTTWTAALWYNNLYPTGDWRTLLRGDNYHPVIIDAGSWRLGAYINGFQPAKVPGTNNDYYVPAELQTGWHLFAAVAQAAANETDFYIDGNLVAVLGMKDVQNVVSFGRIQGDNQTFSQYLDEFRYYNRALSATEIQQILTPVGNAAMGATAVQVLEDSSISKTQGGGVDLGPLTFTGNGKTLTTSLVSGTYSFPSLTLGAGVTSATYSSSADTTLTAGITDGGNIASITKQGSGALALIGAGSLQSGSVLYVQGGKLTLVGSPTANPLGSGKASLNAPNGSVELSALSAAGTTAIGGTIDVNENCTFTAAKFAGGVANGTISLAPGGMSIAGGRQLDLTTKDGYQVQLNGAVNGAGATINVTAGSNVAVNAAITADRVTDYGSLHLNVANGINNVGMTTVSNAGALNLGVSPAAGTNVTLNDGGSLRATNAGVTFGPNTTLTITGAGGVLGGGTQNYAVSSPVNMPTPTVLRKTGSETVTLNGLPNTLDGVTGTVKVDNGGLDVRSVVQYAAFLNVTGGAVEVNADFLLDPNSSMMNNNLNYGRFEANGTGWSGGNYALNGNYSPAPGDVFTGTTAGTPMQYIAANPNSWLKGQQTGQMLFANASRINDRPYGLQPNPWPGKGVYEPNSNFGYLWTGYLNVPAGKGGQWGLNPDWIDGVDNIAIDLNGDGDFTDAGEALGNNQTIYAQLQAGRTYPVAFSFYGGGNNCTAFRYQQPNDGNWYLINPSDAAQAGLWSSSLTTGIAISGGAINVNPGHRLAGQSVQISGGTLTVSGSGAGGTLETNALVVSGGGALNIGATVGGDPGKLVIHGNLIEQYGAATGNFINLNGTFLPDGPGTIKIRGGTAWAPLLATFNAGIVPGDATNAWAPDLSGFGAKYNANFAGATGYGTSAVANNAILNLTVPGAVRAGGSVNLVADAGAAIPSAGELRISASGAVGPGAVISGSGRWYVNVAVQQTGAGQVPYLDVTDKAAVGGDLTGFTILSVPGSGPQNIFLEDGAIYAGTAGAAPTWATQGASRQLWKGLLASEMNSPGAVLTVGTNGAGTGVYGKGVALGNWTYPDGVQTAAFTGTIQQVPGAVDGSVKVLLNNGFALTLNSATLNLNTGSIASGNKYQFDEVGNLTLVSALGAASTAKRFDVNGLPNRQNANVLTLQSGAALINNNQLWTVTNGRIYTAGSSADGLVANQSILNVSQSATLHMDRWLNSGYINIAAGGALRVQDTNCLNNIGQVTAVGSPNLTPLSVPSSTINIDTNAPAGNYPLMLVTAEMGGGNAPIAVAMKNMNIVMARTDADWHSFRWNSSLNLGNNRYLMSPQGLYQYLPGWWDGGTTNQIYAAAAGTAGNMVNIGIAKFGPDSEPTRFQLQDGRVINYDGKAYVNTTFGSHAPLMGIASVNDYTRVYEIPAGAIYLPNAYVNSGGGTGVANVWSGRVRKYNYNAVEAGLTWNVEGTAYNNANYTATLEIDGNSAGVFANQTVNVRNLGTVRGYFWRDWQAQAPSVINNRLTGGTYNFYDGGTLQLLTNYDDWNTQTNQAQITTIAFDDGTVNYNVMPSASVKFTSDVYWNDNDHSIAKIAKVTMKGGSTLTLSTIGNRSWDIPSVDASDGDVTIARTGARGTDFTNGNRAVIGTLKGAAGKTLSLTSDTAVNYPITISAFAGGADAKTWPGTLRFPAGAPNATFPSPTTVVNDVITSGTGAMTINGSFTIGGSLINNGRVISNISATIGPAAGSTVKVAAVSGAGAFVPAANTTLTLDLPITGAGSQLNTAGGGTVQLNVLSSHDGGTSIAGPGTLVSKGANTAGAALGTGPLSIATGGTLRVDPGVGNSQYLGAVTGAANSGTIVGHTGIVDFGAKTITNESAQYHYGMVQEGMLTPSNPPGSGNHPADATNTPPSWLETSSTRGLLGGSFPGATTNLPWPTLGGPDQTTIVYRGQFFWPGSASGNVTLAENCDDWTWLRLDGAVVLNDGAWNTPTAWTGALGKGWHDFEVRVGNGGGGYGASGQNNNGWVNWTGAFGFGFDPTADVNNKDAATFKAFSASTDYQYDDGTGNAAFQLRYMAEGGVIAVDPGAAVKAGAIVNGTVKLNGAGNAATLALNDAAALRPSTVDTLTVLGGAGVISTGTNTSLAVASLTVPAGASLTKMGPGDLSVLNGTISGELNVNGGVFRAPTVAGGGLVSGTINVNAGGIMTGTGAASVVGSDSAPAAVAVNTGGLLSAGNSAAPGDVLTINGAGVTLNGAGGLLAKMGTSQGSDLSDVIAIGASGGVPGTLAFGPGAAPVVIVDDRGVVTDHYYKFLSFSGADPELVNWIVGTSDPNQVNKSWVLDGNGPWGTPNNAEQWSGSASVAGTVVYPTDPDGIPGWLTVHITGSGKLPPGPISNATIVPVAGATRDIVVDGPLTSAGIASLTIGGAHNHLATLALTTGDLAVAGATAVNAGGLLTTGDAALGNTGNFQTSTLSVAGAMSVGAGTTANVAGAATVSGTLNVPGTFNANSLTSSGSVSFLGAGNVAILTVSGGNTALSGSQTVGVANVSGGSLAASAGSIGTLRVTGGSADISGGTVATASISGGAGNKFRGGAVTTATFSGGDTTVSGPAAVTTATVSAGATLGLNNGGGTPVGSLIVNGGNVSVGAAGAIIGRGDFKAAAGTVNAAHPLAVTTGLTFQDSYSASFTGDGVVTSFSATGANLGNNNVDRTLTLSGGSLALAKYSAPVGTVAWYKFDDPGNWGLDSIGGHNMRIVAGSPTAAATAHSGGAIQWANGQSMRIDGADFPSLAGQLPDAQGQTLIMWLKRSAIDINQQGTSGIMAGLGNGSNDHYTWDNGLAYFNTFRNNSRVDNIPVDTSAVQQTWHMIAIVRNPADGTWKFYSNVAEKMSTALAGYQLDNYWEIGRNTNNNYWSGSMDDVMLVNRALSPAELATVYGAAGGAVALPKTHIALAPGAAATLDLGGADLDHSLGNLSLSDGATLTLKEAKTVTFQNVTNATGSGTATVEYFNPATGAVIPLVVKGSLAPAGQMIINTDLHLATGSSASFNLTAKPNETYQQVSLNFNNGLTFQTGVGDLNVRFDAGPDVVGAGAYHLFTGVYPGYMDTGGGANLFRNTTIANATDGAPLGFQWHDFDPVANGIQWINYDDIQGNVDVQLDLANVAQTIATWKNTTGNGRWGTAGNWDSTPPGLVPTGPAAVAKFDRTLGSPNGGTVNVDGPKTVGSLIFNSSNSYTLTGSDLTLDNTGLGSATITVAAGADTISARLVLAGNLTLLPAVGTRLTLGDLDESPVGSGRKLTLNDRGTVVLSGTSTFTGLVTVNKGELEITTGGAWPPGNDLVVGPDADVVLVPDLIFGGASVSAVHRAPSAVTAVPEPGALALVAIGALSALFVLRLRRVR